MSKRLERFAQNAMESTVHGDDPVGAGAPALRLDPKGVGVTRLREAIRVSLDRIIPDPDQPRKEFDEEGIQLLADDLKSRGQIQPVVVRWDQSIERYVLVVGERRYRAAMLAGLPYLNCIEEVQPKDYARRLEDQLVENCLREDLKPIEQANAFRNLMTTKGINGKQLAELLHIAPSKVSRILALLNLDEQIQTVVDEGRLPHTIASEVAKVRDAKTQHELVQAITEDKLNYEDVRRMVKQKSGGRIAQPRFTYEVASGKVIVESDSPIQALQEALKRAKQQLKE